MEGVTGVVRLKPPSATGGHLARRAKCVSSALFSMSRTFKAIIHLHILRLINPYHFVVLSPTAHPCASEFRRRTLHICVVASAHQLVSEMKRFAIQFNSSHALTVRTRCQRLRALEIRPLHVAQSTPRQLSIFPHRLACHQCATQALSYQSLV